MTRTEWSQIQVTASYLQGYLTAPTQLSLSTTIKAVAIQGTHISNSSQAPLSHNHGYISVIIIIIKCWNDNTYLNVLTIQDKIKNQ